MANPQIENGYTAVANEILDNLYKFSLNGTELKVISCIFRYTFGFHRKSHKLSASFIARWGNCDLRAVKRALKKLQQDRIIICINSEQRGVTAELMFNKNYEQSPPVKAQDQGNHSRSTGCLDKYTVFSSSLSKSHVLLLDL